MSEPRRVRLVRVRQSPGTSNAYSDVSYVSLSAEPWRQAVSDEERIAILRRRVERVLAQERRL